MNAHRSFPTLYVATGLAGLAALLVPGKVNVGKMKARAQALLGDAIGAYATARSEEACS